MDEQNRQQQENQEQAPAVEQPAAMAEKSAPVGTYPPVPQQPPPPPVPEKRHWVGTITIALGLIAVGAIMVAWVFVPNLDIVFFARLSPLILVCFGVEILWASVRHHGEKLRVNFLTAFMCLVLVCGSLLAAVVPQAAQWYVQSDRTAGRLKVELEEASYQMLKDDATLSVSNVEWYVNVGYDSAADMTPAQIRPEEYVQVRVFMPNAYKDKHEFAKACRQVANKLQTQVPHIDYATFLSWDEERPVEEATGQRYSLWLSNRWQFDASEAELEDYVLTEYWDEEEARFMNEEELAYREEERAWEAEVDAAESEVEDEGDVDGPPDAADAA